MNFCDMCHNVFFMSDKLKVFQTLIYYLTNGLAPQLSTKAGKKNLKLENLNDKSCGLNQAVEAKDQQKYGGYKNHLPDKTSPIRKRATMGLNQERKMLLNSVVWQ